MISSAIPSAKYSFSGSALMLANGSTATDFAADVAAFGSVSVFVGVDIVSETRACENCADVVNRSPDSVDIAFEIAQSMFCGTEGRSDWSDLGLSVNRFAMIDWGVEPEKGRSPPIISYNMHARLYWSLLPSRFVSPAACSGLT